MSQTNRAELFGSRHSSRNIFSNAHSSGWSSVDDDSLLPENPSDYDIEQLKSQQKKLIKGGLKCDIFPRLCYSLIR